MDKCFCHLFGYAVKDASARKTIEHLKIAMAQLQGQQGGNYETVTEEDLDAMFAGTYAPGGSGSGGDDSGGNTDPGGDDSGGNTDPGGTATIPAGMYFANQEMTAPGSDLSAVISFISSSPNVEYSAVYAYATGVIKYDGLQVYDPTADYFDTWSNVNHRMFVVEEDQLVSEAFYNWFMENYKLQGGSDDSGGDDSGDNTDPGGTATIPAGGYFANQTMTNPGVFIEQKITFISSSPNVVYTSVYVTEGNVHYDLSMVYNAYNGLDGWADVNNRIFVVNEDQEVSEAFYNWFMENYKLQGSGGDDSSSGGSGDSSGSAYIVEAGNYEFTQYLQFANMNQALEFDVVGGDHYVLFRTSITGEELHYDDAQDGTMIAATTSGYINQHTIYISEDQEVSEEFYNWFVKCYAKS